MVDRLCSITKCDQSDCEKLRFTGHASGGKIDDVDATGRAKRAWSPRREYWIGNYGTEKETWREYSALGVAKWVDVIRLNCSVTRKESRGLNFTGEMANLTHEITDCDILVARALHYEREGEALVIDHEFNIATSLVSIKSKLTELVASAEPACVHSFDRAGQGFYRITSAGKVFLYCIRLILNNLINSNGRAYAPIFNVTMTFIDELRPLNAYRGRHCGLEYGLNLNRVFEEFKKICRSKKYCDDRKIYYRSVQANIKSVGEYVNSLIFKYKDFDVIRIDLYYKKSAYESCKNEKSNILARLIKYRALLVSRMRRHKIFMGLLGWVMKLDFSNCDVYCVRAVFFFHSNNERSRDEILNSIGNYWTIGVTGGDGDFHSRHNMQIPHRRFKAILEFPVQSVAEDDQESIDRCLVGINSLFRGDYYAKIKSGNGNRIFLRGDMPNSATKESKQRDFFLNSNVME